MSGRAIPQAPDDVVEQLLMPEDDIQLAIEHLVSAKLVCVSDGDGLLSLTKYGETLLTKLDNPIMTTHRRQLSHLFEGELVELNRLLVKARDPAS